MCRFVVLAMYIRTYVHIIPLLSILKIYICMPFLVSSQGICGVDLQTNKIGSVNYVHLFESSHTKYAYNYVHLFESSHTKYAL